MSHHHTPTQKAALRLYEAGLNVFPLPLHQKSGYPWMKLQTSRLFKKDLLALTARPCNLAVITGRVSGNLFVIDCETENSFKYQLRRLRGAKIPIWAVRTGGKAKGGHFYLRCEDGEVSNVKSQHNGSYEIRGTHCYVVAPPSLHPETGRPYTWFAQDEDEPPLVKISDVPWLSLKLASPKRGKRTPPPYPDLSTRNRDFIAHGAPEGERNNRLFAAACDMAGNEYSIYTAHDILRSAAAGSGLENAEINHTIGSAYSKPRDPARFHNRNEANALKPWEKAMAWGEEQQWKGRSGMTDRAVFLACCERAKHSNKEGAFRASCREIAEAARIGSGTASASLRRLVKRGLLIPHGRDRTSTAHIYALGKITQEIEAEKVAKQHTRLLHFEGVPNVLSSQQLLPSDAAEQGALGKTPYFVYRVMCRLDRPVCQRELVQVSGLSKHQVFRAMVKLQKFELVQKDGRAYTAIALSCEELDRLVAKPLGKAGAALRRSKRFEQDRSEFAARVLWKAMGSYVSVNRKDADDVED
jgi:hypothetical protein